MVAWWTNLDIEIVCSHRNSSVYIQISNLENGCNYIQCLVCGQFYQVSLDIKPFGEPNE